LKVFNLCCAAEHRFEGWFASAADYDEQLARGLLRCPVCDSAEVRKLPSAPHLNFGAESPPTDPARPSRPGGGNGAAPTPATPAASAPPAVPEEMRLHVLKALHKLVSESEDVGPHFAEVARRIHRGDEDERNIRGTATPEERAELEDEGIDVLTLPFPAGTKETLQ